MLTLFLRSLSIVSWIFKSCPVIVPLVSIYLVSIHLSRNSLDNGDKKASLVARHENSSPDLDSNNNDITTATITTTTTNNKSNQQDVHDNGEKNKENRFTNCVQDLDQNSGLEMAFSDFDPLVSLDPEPKKNPKVQFRQPPSTPLLIHNDADLLSLQHGPSTPMHPVLHQHDLDFGEDEFRPASEIFNDTAAWTMLEQFGSSKKKLDTSTLTRESLYVRFDPLVRKKSPKAGLTGLIKEENESGGRIPNTTDEDLLMMNTPPLKDRKAAKRRLNTTVQNELDLMFTCTGIEPRGNSPPTLDSAPTSLSNVQEGIVEVLKYSEADMQKVLVDYQARILAKERDFEQKEHEFEVNLRELRDENLHMKQANDDMQKLLSEYERTVSQVISDKAKFTSTKEDSLTEAIKERDQSFDQLRTMESAFSDLYGRYEKAKVAVETLKTNEEELKKCMANYQQKIKKHEQRYDVLKQHAQEKLNSANEEIDKVHKSKNSEITKVQAALKRCELQNKSLQTAFDQKIKENEELTSICDDLIKQVGDT